MATGFSFTFSAEEVDAVSRALEQAGVGSGDWRVMLESFGNAQTANAAKRARSILRGRVDRSIARNDISLQRDDRYVLDEPNPVEVMRDQIRDLSDEVRTLRRNRRSLVEDLESLLSSVDRGFDELAKRKLEELVAHLKADAASD